MSGQSPCDNSQPPKAGIEVLIEASQAGLLDKVELSPQDKDKLESDWADFKNGRFLPLSELTRSRLSIDDH